MKSDTQRNLVKILGPAICLCVLLGLLPMVACDSDDNYAEGSPCGDVCERLLECGGDEFYESYDSVGECANECQDIQNDSTMECMNDCGGSRSCEAFRICILDC